MTSPQKAINIESVGIADILQRWRLHVPLNQRPYAWEDDNVEKLFQDLNNAVLSKPIYFIGTVMFTHDDAGKIEVADGQQRLATISILIAAIRDFLIELDDTAGANSYEADFLIKYDPPSGSYMPRLRLNVQDDEFFHSSVLLPPAKRTASVAGIHSSNARIADASRAAADHVRNITAGLAKVDKAKRLYEWLNYIKEAAFVIVVSVPRSVGNSFRMFETLNARGVPASQVDILKNFLFDRAPSYGDRINAHWLSMLSIIEAHGGDDLVLTYIRHLWISHHGPTTVDELGSSLEDYIINEQRALDFVALLDAAASDYAAILKPSQSNKWDGFSGPSRKALDIVMTEFGAEQIRPLVLAVSRTFPSDQVQQCLIVFLSWSVRFLIVGGGGGGKLDRYYGRSAKSVTDRSIMDAQALFDSMTNVVPNDVSFQTAFAESSVKRGNLARYYLRAIDYHLSEDKEPQFLLSEDPNTINLEHIMPMNPPPEWKVDTDTANAYHRRIGNMVLLGSRDNVELGKRPFPEKKKVYETSEIEVTKDVLSYDEWGPVQIRERQARLAALAPKVWPLKWK